MKKLMKIKTNSHTACILARKLTAEGNPSKWMGAVEMEKVQLMKVTNVEAAVKTIAGLNIEIEVTSITSVNYETPEVNDASNIGNRRFLKDNVDTVTNEM